MAMDVFLAMTAAEICGNRNLPANLGWMACHFSPYGTGLSNLPKQLPPSSLLIRELRESKQLTQQEIAKVLQVTQECYSRYEGGQRDIPTKTLIKLADFHNTTIDYLLDRTMKQSAI